MFTGIVEELGAVEALRPLTIRCRLVLEDLKPGASVAINGVCLTAVDIRPDAFSADVSQETLDRSTLGGLRPGAVVNLERALSPAGRLGGHIVQGHVDATGEFLSLETVAGENRWLKVRVPDELRRYVVVKGSIAVDGISLTVAALEGDALSATIIPHTYASTNLGFHRAGDRVNLEADILAKYVERLLTAIGGGPGLTEQRLRELGY